NGLSVANLVAGLSSILCSLNRQYHHSCWLLLVVGSLLDLADGAVARQLDACSALGAKLDDFADFTTFGLATALLLQPRGGLVRGTAVVMMFFMVDRGYYPHDKVLESQRWKKVVYAGGVVAVLFSPVAGGGG
ncbi:PREDICTED: LOW QUALITY PROTEIN: uncharacterized protein LOC104375347, partial [Tauraco erythrolophus]|uniref:LOW QUALITY PROTEIN: uncharacterized protein LOC104375347 n=1 Tax=Tauraco erythrolophus TaxID=121530 RepID=UPI000523E424